LKSDISDIFITHLHPDHFWRLLDRDGASASPNATVHIARAEADYWLSPTMANAPASQRDWFDQARRALQPYASLGHVRPFDGETAFFPGFRARPAPGHTPGNSIYLLESDGERIAFVQLIQACSPCIVGGGADAHFSTSAPDC
jgi:glyoxylase-like metal-dependent hydrolase (beta-lactamase superfamily II)